MEGVIVHQNTILESAQALIDNRASIDGEKTKMIDRLRQQRADIDAALVALGAKRKPATPPKKRGRPVGSKNKPVPPEAA